MRPRWVIKGYSFGFKSVVPKDSDVDFPIDYIWINVSTDVAYILGSIVDGKAVWMIKNPDSVLNEGTVSQVNIIGESSIGNVVTSVPGTGLALPEGIVLSTPGDGERRVTNIRISDSEKVIITYLD